MQVASTSIPGSWVFTPTLHTDERGVFLESYTQASLEQTTGRTLEVKQTNVSVSAQGTIRGIHFADVPPGQAKYVQCYQGRILDVVVDIRVGSPTFGQWDCVELDAESRRALFISEGLGHAFCALSESATVGYMCSEPYAPAREHGIHPLDSTLDIQWPEEIPHQLSPKDSSAPSLEDALKWDLLPRWTVVSSGLQEATQGKRQS